ncbi:MAG: aminomethyltransferase family protein [Acidobacteriota bacterium]
MSEVVETPTLLKSPLNDKHRELGARMIEYEGWLLPGSYGDESSEYATVREGGAGLIDFSSRGRFLVTGSEAVQFLNGLITNDMKTLVENRWMPAAFPNVQGRLIASVRIVRASDAKIDTNVSPAFFVDTEAVTHERVLKTVERFTLAGDFRVTDITNRTAHLTLQGKRAADVIQAVLGEEASSLAMNGAGRTPWHDGEVTVIRASYTGEDGFDLIVNSEHVGSLWDSLRNAGARPVGHDALETLRIEAGIPRYGIDMDETNVVTEAALDEAVSYTKGCYVGQEIIARIKYRGHVAKKLSGLVFNQRVEIEAGANIRSLDEKDIGRITSATYSPRLSQTIALAYLKYDYLAAGTEVKVRGGSDEVMASVAALPFVNSKPASEQIGA